MTQRIRKKVFNGLEFEIKITGTQVNYLNRGPSRTEKALLLFAQNQLSLKYRNR